MDAEAFLFTESYIGSVPVLGFVANAYKIVDVLPDHETANRNRGNTKAAERAKARVELLKQSGAIVET
jgi:hypothetical protein